MTTVIGVRFKKIGKLYYFDPCDKQIATGESVIVETSRGMECGEVVLGNTQVEDNVVVQPLRRVIRIATRADLQITEENRRRAQEAYAICKQKIENHKLDMHLVEAECTFDLNKILFYFTADGRVDFRDLVKDLAGVFHTRIELRQIGVRDEAKMIGGLGACGRELCCASYMDEFQPVSINMAKDQNLSLNPAKISGTCGRLMCCLKYEHEVYAELQKTTPRQGSYVETPEGPGTVVSVQMLRGMCRVQLEDTTDAPKQFACADCRIVRMQKGRAKGGAEAETAPVAGDAESSAERRQYSSERPARHRPQEGETQPQRSRRTDGSRPPRQQNQNAPVREKGGADGAEAPRRRSHRGGRRNKVSGDAQPGAAQVPSGAEMPSENN